MVDTESRKGRRPRYPRACRRRANRSRSPRPSARAPPIVASSSAWVAEIASARSSRARAQRDHRPELLEEVVGRHRRDAVRADADPQARGSKLRKRRDPAAEHCVRARTMRDRDAVACEQLDLFVVDLHAMRGHHVARRAGLRREAPDAALAVRLDQHLGQRAATALRRGAASRARRRSRSSALRPAARATRRRRTPPSSRCTARVATRRA